MSKKQKPASASTHIQRIHITGGPGSGKTTLSLRIAASLNLPLYDLDGMALQLEAAGKPIREMAGEALRIAASDAWVSDGAYMGWAEPLFRSADLIIWLDIPWRVASYRIITRHLKATLARNNRFPGWRRLYAFLQWSKRYYYDQADHVVNQYGTPNTRQTTVLFLQPYRDKLVICRNSSEVRVLLVQTLGIAGG